MAIAEELPVSIHPFDPNRDHRITREEAADLIQAFQVRAKEDAHRATAFSRQAFEQLLAQPHAAGVRIYQAQHKGGSATLVMVAVNAQGQDLADHHAVFIQRGTDCPPNCGATSWF
jgi:hypothetical protein